MHQDEGRMVVSLLGTAWSRFELAVKSSRTETTAEALRNCEIEVRMEGNERVKERVCMSVYACVSEEVFALF